MIYQNDAQFPNEIQHFGCYFLSLCFQLDRIFNLNIMNYESIIEIYNAEESDSDLGAECYMQNPQGLCDHIISNGVIFKGIVAEDYETQDGEFEIQRWYNPNTDFHHFVAGQKGAVIYDPIRGGSLTVRVGRMDGKRIFALK